MIARIAPPECPRLVGSYVKMSQIYQRFLVHAIGIKCIRHLRGELDEALPKEDAWSVPTDKVRVAY